MGNTERTSRSIGAMGKKKTRNARSLQQTVKNRIWVSRPTSVSILEVKQKKRQTDPYDRKTEVEENKMNMEYYIPKHFYFYLLLLLFFCRKDQVAVSLVLTMSNQLYSVCMEIQCQIISMKFKFSNICKLKTHSTRKTETLLIKFEECSCVRKRVINFYVFYSFVCKFFRRLY